MNIIQFPITCSICSKKSQKKEQWIIFNKTKRLYEEKAICLKCAENALEAILGETE